VKFTNITRAGMYFTCCHREVAPGESFYAPWPTVRNDRAVRTAMQEGVVAWESGKDEPEVPGSPRIPSAEARAAQAAARKAKEAAQHRADAARAKAQRDADNKAVGEQMARMGTFKVPGPIPLRQPERVGERERPITAADIISSGKPQSLADVIRHNRAVRLVQAQAQEAAAKAAKAKREQREQQAQTQNTNT